MNTHTHTNTNLQGYWYLHEIVVLRVDADEVNGAKVKAVEHVLGQRYKTFFAANFTLWHDKLVRLALPDTSTLT
jgi:hypothetical protein